MGGVSIMAATSTELQVSIVGHYAARTTQSSHAAIFVLPSQQLVSLHFIVERHANFSRTDFIIPPTKHSPSLSLSDAIQTTLF